jgi:hypothetical protein
MKKNLVLCTLALILPVLSANAEPGSFKIQLTAEPSLGIDWHAYPTGKLWIGNKIDLPIPAKAGESKLAFEARLQSMFRIITLAQLSKHTMIIEARITEGGTSQVLDILPSVRAEAKESTQALFIVDLYNQLASCRNELLSVRGANDTEGLKQASNYVGRSVEKSASLTTESAR